MEMMPQFLTLVGQLEMRGQHEQSNGGPPKRQTERFSGGTVLCLVIKKLLCAIDVDKRAICKRPCTTKEEAFKSGNLRYSSI